MLVCGRMRALGGQAVERRTTPQGSCWAFVSRAEDVLTAPFEGYPLGFKRFREVSNFRFFFIFFHTGPPTHTHR